MNLKAFELLTAFDSKQLLSNKLALEVSWIFKIKNITSKYKKFFIEHLPSFIVFSRFLVSICAVRTSTSVPTIGGRIDDNLLCLIFEKSIREN